MTKLSVQTTQYEPSKTSRSYRHLAYTAFCVCICLFFKDIIHIVTKVTLLNNFRYRFSLPNNVYFNNLIRVF